MIKNYFKTAWRSLIKNKTFSFINIAGLSIGIAACLLILEYVSFELSYDQFNKNSADIYRISNDRYQNGKLIQHGTITYSAIGRAMKHDFPEVVDNTRFVGYGKNILTYNNKKIGEQTVIAVDSSFLTMFTYPLVAGDYRSALREPLSVIISESCADKVFNTRGENYESVLGKLVVMGTDSMPYKVTGIIKDIPQNSHLQFDCMISFVTLFSGPHPWKEADYDFTDSDFWHYIQLKHGTDYKALESKLDAFSDRYFKGNKVSGSVEKFHLQPLSKAHLYSDFEYEQAVTGSATVVWGLLAIAILIIVIAWVNYVNLSTAKSMERAKEVGVRKVTGATKGQLIRQFLTESVIINAIAFCIAMLGIFLVQKAFNGLIKHQLSLGYLFSRGLSGYSIIVSVIALLVAGIFVSGFYPAFVLSSFKPVLVLKGKYSGTVKGIFLRKALVTGQFAITVILIIGSLVVYRQLKFVNEQDLGVNISRMLIVKPPELTGWDSGFISRENTFTSELSKLPGVVAASTSWSVLGNELGRSFNIRRKDKDQDAHYTMRHTGISLGYLELYQVRILAGRSFISTDFNENFGKVHNMILNQSAVELLGFGSPMEAIGKTIMRGSREWEVVGVINDYHQKSMHYAIEPTWFMPAYSTNSNISIKINSKNVNSCVAGVRQLYDRFFPGNLFDFYFLDNRVNDLYSNDQLFGKVFAIFAGFAIFIACLGLMGLSLFATTQRTKEIGIRKVLGASVSNIILLLSGDFVKLVVISFIIATPVAWMIMHSWLQDFAYRINMSWWIFVLAGFLAVTIALATISFQAVKAALANPAGSLRSE